MFDSISTDRPKSSRLLFRSVFSISTGLLCAFILPWVWLAIGLYDSQRGDGFDSLRIAGRWITHLPGAIYCALITSNAQIDHGPDSFAIYDQSFRCFAMSLFLNIPYYSIIIFCFASWLDKHRQKVNRKRETLLLIVIVASIAALLAAPVRATTSPANAQSVASTSTLHQWGAITLFHGLPSDHVRALTQDASGAMWFGTDAGLVKYDGRRVARIASEGICAGRILALSLDQAGVLWIGTNAGAARLINGEIVTISETTGSAVTAITSPGSGLTYFTTEQGQIFECASINGGLRVNSIQPKHERLLSIESRANAPVPLTSVVLHERNLIVGTHSRGLLSFHTDAMSELFKTGAANPITLADEIFSQPRPFFVETITKDGAGHLWIGAQTSADDSGIYECADINRPAKIRAGTGTITAMTFDQRGSLWAGSENKGAFTYRSPGKLEQFTFENTGGGLLSNRIYSIFADREGVIWFGTDRGVCRYDPNSVFAQSVSNDPDSNFIRVLFQRSNGTLLCGTNRGLFVRDNSSNWKELAQLKGRVIHSIAEDPQRRLLVGTTSGLFLESPASNHNQQESSIIDEAFSRIDATVPSDNIRAIELFEGVVYLANFGRGIERIDGSGRTLVWPDENAEAGARNVVSLHADKQRLWIGTAEAGVFCLQGGGVKSDPVFDELRGAGVWSIDGTFDDILWLASARGLYAFQTGKLRRLLNDVDTRWVVSEAANESTHSAWCATVGEGLHKVRIESGPDPDLVVSRMDAEQGLPSQNAFAIARVRDLDRNGLLIGTSRGVAMYFPDQVAPAFQFTRVLGKRLYDPSELRSSLSLDYPQNSLAIDAAASSSRTFPEQFQYSFVVLDDAGRVISHRTSHDSQLLIEGFKSGGYRVVARAFTKDLVASEPLEISFVVGRAPFPWTSTALSLLLVLALLALWWGYRQNRRLAGTNQQLTETRMQLANETETERRRIARDLHDQTLADLRRLMMMTDQLPTPERSNGHIKPSQLRGEIETISTEIRRICEDLSPSALANVGLSAALEWALVDSVSQLPPDKRFEYEFDCDATIDDQIGLDPATQIQIFRIVQEALSNVCRHSEASSVRLSMKIGPDKNLTIELENNGRDFDAAHKSSGRGLTNIRSRANMIRGSVSWEPVEKGGVVFRLIVPLTSVELHTAK